MAQQCCLVMLPVVGEEENTPVTVRFNKGKVKATSVKKRLQCEYSECEYETDFRTNMKNHVITHHTDMKPFPCAHCEYRAKQAAHLAAHTRAKHAGERPVKCSYPSCSYSTNTAGILKTHTRAKHTGERPYKCSYHHCHYRYAQADNLDRYIKFIQGIRCNQSEYCKKKNCKLCPPCLDMKKHGGSGRKKKACLQRKCSHPSYSTIMSAPPEQPPQSLQ